MSIIEGKNILVVGDETTQVHGIEMELEAEGAIIHRTNCVDVTVDSLESDKIDVIFLNHLHESSPCITLLQSLRDSRETSLLPIFALVENDEDKIEHALSLGAADYFTATETIEKIISKVKIILGEPQNTTPGEILDIGLSRIHESKAAVKVLIVEDDPLLSNLLAIRFEQANFPCHFNHDGKEVLKDILEFKPHILILDLMLPGVSGLDILEEIRTNQETSSLPVIIFSNRDGAEDKKRAAELGVSGFFVKAMTDLVDLVETIEKKALTVDE